MKRIIILALLTVGLLAGGTALALSVERPTPGIEFPKGYDQTRADAVLAVLQDKQFHYAGGLTSYWEPAFGTTLVYEGDTKSLAKMLDDLAKINGIHVRLTFSKDLAKETGSALSAGSWWVKYSHVTPDVITVRINLAAADLDLSKLDLRVSSAGTATK